MFRLLTNFHPLVLEHLVEFTHVIMAYMHFGKWIRPDISMEKMDLLNSSLSSVLIESADLHFHYYRFRPLCTSAFSNGLYLL